MENEKWALRWRKFRYILTFTGIFIIYLLIVLIAHPSKMATLYLGGFAAFFQTVIAVSAIWGNEIRALFLGPDLRLTLDRSDGQITKLRPDNLPARYFHLRVHNRRKGTPATKAQVILYSILPPHTEGAPEPLVINGRLPFPWKFRGGDPDPQIRFLEPVMYSVIGPDDYCDLARLIKGSEVLELQAEHWMLVADFLNVRGGQKTTVEAIAIAENGQSNLLTLDIFWDGVWPGEENEHVTEHIKIEPSRPLSKRKKKADC
jgi:hypothetical protein